jgi:hypothetical protein
VKREPQDDSSVAKSPDLQLTLIKSYGGGHFGPTLPSEKLVNFLRSSETDFSTCKTECFQSTDVQQTLLQRCSALLNDTDIPHCHDLGPKILNFFRLRLHVFCKEVSRHASDESQHGSKSVKSRTSIK